MLASETRQKDNSFAFKRIDEEDGGFYHFMPMNLNIYENKVKNI